MAVNSNKPFRLSFSFVLFLSNNFKFLFDNFIYFVILCLFCERILKIQCKKMKKKLAFLAATSAILETIKREWFGQGNRQQVETSKNIDIFHRNGDFVIIPAWLRYKFDQTCRRIRVSWTQDNFHLVNRLETINVLST